MLWWASSWRGCWNRGQIAQCAAAGSGRVCTQQRTGWWQSRGALHALHDQEALTHLETCGSGAALGTAGIVPIPLLWFVARSGSRRLQRKWRQQEGTPGRARVHSIPCEAARAATALCRRTRATPPRAARWGACSARPRGMAGTRATGWRQLHTAGSKGFRGGNGFPRLEEPMQTRGTRCGPSDRKQGRGVGACDGWARARPSAAISSPSTAKPRAAPLQQAGRAARRRCRRQLRR